MAIKQIDKPQPIMAEEAPPHLCSDEALRLHVPGQSKFICDEPKPERLCHAVIVPSPHAHARILGINTSTARKQDGVIALLTWQDIPGENQLGVKFKDEPLLPQFEVCYIGQPVVLLVAETRAAAKQAAQSVLVNYEILEPILTIENARRVNSLIAPEFGLSSGNLEAGFLQSEHILEGIISS